MGGRGEGDETAGAGGLATTHTDALPVPLILTGFVPDPRLPHLWHAPMRTTALAKFGWEGDVTASL